MSGGRAVANPGDGKVGDSFSPEPGRAAELLGEVVMIDLGDVIVLSLECRRGEDCREWVV